jgi:hypothetical protein
MIITRGERTRVIDEQGKGLHRRAGRLVVRVPGFSERRLVVDAAAAAA